MVRSACTSFPQDRATDVIFLQDRTVGVSFLSVKECVRLLRCTVFTFRVSLRAFPLMCVSRRYRRLLPSGYESAGVSSFQDGAAGVSFPQDRTLGVPLFQNRTTGVPFLLDGPTASPIFTMGLRLLLSSGWTCGLSYLQDGPAGVCILQDRTAVVSFLQNGAADVSFFQDKTAGVSLL